MKNIVEYLQSKNVIFKSLKQITAKDLGTRKKINIYLGVDLTGFYADVMHLEKKSRVLRKEVEVLILLHEKLEIHVDTKIKKKYIFIQAPLCSKAKAQLEEKNWKVWNEG